MEETKIIISYRKFEAKKGKPIAVSNDHSEIIGVEKAEIYTSRLVLQSVSGDIIFHSDNKSKHGTLAPLIIPVIDETVTDGVIITDEKERKNFVERLRYRKLNPIQKRYRKEMIV